MPMTLTELKALADAATPGEWCCFEENTRLIYNGPALIVECHWIDRGYETAYSNAAYIAAMRPEVAKAMIEVIQRAYAYMDAIEADDNRIAWGHLTHARRSLDDALKGGGDE